MSTIKEGAASAPDAVGATAAESRKGEAGEPIRVLLFAGGGFGTAMQLGVTHALLVSRAKPPDVVVGVSAGAVNAALLAEVLQAGGPEDGEAKRRSSRVARFREIFAAFQRAPGELFTALTPDSFQIDTQRPLEPLQLPIHSQRERGWRAEAMSSRSGLMAVVNHLLDLRLPIGTVVRGVRRYLGYQSAREIPGTMRPLVQLAEILHGMLLLAPNLGRLSPLVRQVALSASFRPGPPRGASAGDLIFQWRRAERAVSFVLNGAVTLLLVPAWWLGAFLLAFVGPPVVLAWIFFASLLPWFGRILGATWTSLRGKPSRWSTVWGASRRLGRLTREFLHFKFLGVWLRLVLWLAVFGVAAWGCAWILAWTAAQAGWEVGPFAILVWAVGLLLGLFVVSFAPVVLLFRHLSFRFFARYQIARSLFHPHPLRQMFVDLLDRGYFATVGSGTIDDVVARALDPAQPWPKASTGGTKAQPRTLASYSRASPSIRVAVVAADLAKGDNEVLPEEVRVVDALLAATAVSPIFPPHPLEIGGEKRLFIDGVNIANEPTRPALTFLRREGLHGAGELRERLEKAPAVHFYPVSSLSIRRSELPFEDDGPEDASLLEVVHRALALQRFRDASLERRMTELYSRTIPKGHPKALFETEEKTYLRAWVYPIEPDRPLSANRDLLRARSDVERRRIIARTVADGCRAALETMLGVDLAPVEPGKDGEVHPCLRQVKGPWNGGGTGTGLPGSDAMKGPGVVEVCRHCSLNVVERQETASVPTDELADAAVGLPVWPTVGGEETGAGGPIRAPDPQKEAAAAALNEYRKGDWPQAWAAWSGSERPTVNLLFGGGVFRGVYQVGVVGALSEMGLKPDLVAGASVGAITAAMAARVLSEDDRSARDDALRRLAATYLAVDRLILTDRFADFVRTLTVRGAQSRFSLHDLDCTFRRFDAGRADGFDRVARRVAAGLERLFWISPFELLELMRSLRLQDAKKVEELLRTYFQEILDRSGVGQEVLGTEPLQLLIREHVLNGVGRMGGTAGTPRFDAFLPDGILFLATATNLDRGRLEILGDRQLAGDEGAVSLLQGLLASSAFPGVFRPRWAWEVMPHVNHEDRLTDGGVMDNLPLDAVAQHLQLAAKAGLVKRRPGVPHLVFSASLEPEVGELSGVGAARVAESWRRVLTRSKHLGYNQKVSVYENAQLAMRQIYETSVREKSRGAEDFEPLDLEVVTVRPKWLCGTFAFHPMLGFRREQQAASIAHGCLSTLRRIADVDGRYRDGWGIPADALPVKGWQRPQRRKALKEGLCWYRQDAQCPFAFAATGKSRPDSGLPEVTRRQLDRIHRLCGKPETHRPKPGN